MALAQRSQPKVAFFHNIAHGTRWHIALVHSTQLSPTYACALRDAIGRPSQTLKLDYLVLVPPLNFLILFNLIFFLLPKDTCHRLMRQRLGSHVHQLCASIILFIPRYTHNNPTLAKKVFTSNKEKLRVLHLVYPSEYGSPHEQRCHQWTARSEAKLQTVGVELIRLFISNLSASIVVEACPAQCSQISIKPDLRRDRRPEIISVVPGTDLSRYTYPSDSSDVAD